MVAAGSCPCRCVLTPGPGPASCISYHPPRRQREPQCFILTPPLVASIMTAVSLCPVLGCLPRVFSHRPLSAAPCQEEARLRVACKYIDWGLIMTSRHAPICTKAVGGRMGSGAASLGVCLRSQGKAGPVRPSGSLDLYSHLWRGPVLTHSPHRAKSWGFGCEQQKSQTRGIRVCLAFWT